MPDGTNTPYRQMRLAHLAQVAGQYWTNSSAKITHSYLALALRSYEANLSDVQKINPSSPLGDSGKIVGDFILTSPRSPSTVISSPS